MMTARLAGLAAAISWGLAGGSAWAVGSDTPEPPKPTETTVVCEEGQIWDDEAKACVAIEKSSGLSDDRIHDLAREIAYFGNPEDALRLLAMAADPDAPRLVNLTGFAHRMAGRVEMAMVFYDRALARDPDFLLARSYMGMGLVTLGRMAEAKAQLRQIEVRGGTGGWPHEALRAAIASGVVPARY